MLLTTAACTWALEPVEVSWKRQGKTQFMVINRVEIPYIDNEDAWRRFDSDELPEIGTNSIKVIIPDIPGQKPLLIPGFPGVFRQVFDSLTRPERDVTYVYKNRPLRRYCIRCSSKGTASNADAANYWLDGESLGTWATARARLMSLPWEIGAVVDVLFDHHSRLTDSGIGLYLHPDLKDLVWKHELIVNEHNTYRKVGDD
ncbi:MAG: hypothetical protein V4662_02125 [Verrucomicrobiota bacterium]